MSRRAVHIILGAILVVCVVCPFVELTIGWNDTIFSTGYDTESAVAVIMLLFELVLALASAIAIFAPHVRTTEPLVMRDRVLPARFSFGILLAEFSPPLPLRI